MCIDKYCVITPYGNCEGLCITGFSCTKAQGESDCSCKKDIVAELALED